jgi:DNA-3-methyladenine glycosylase II
MHPTFDASNFGKLVNKLSRQDKDINAIIKKYGHPPMWTRPANFQTLILTILEAAGLTGFSICSI